MDEVWLIISLKQAQIPIVFIVIFETDIERKHLRKV